jgi:hypothetical protein
MGIAFTMKDPVVHEQSAAATLEMKSLPFF